MKPTVTVDAHQLKELLCSVYSHGWLPPFRKQLTEAVEEQTGMILTDFPNAYNGDASEWVDRDNATETQLQYQRTKENY